MWFFRNDGVKNDRHAEIGLNDTRYVPMHNAPEPD